MPFRCTIFGSIVIFFRLMQKLLEFVYSGTVPLDDTALIPTVALADKLGSTAFVESSVSQIIDQYVFSLTICRHIFPLTTFMSSCLLSSLNETTISTAVCLANCINNWRLSNAIIEYLMKGDKSSQFFLKFVNQLNEPLMERLLCYSGLSDEDKLTHLISWFNSRIQKEPHEGKGALEQAVYRLMNGIDGSALSTAFVAAAYSKDNSAFTESPVCR